MLHIRRGELKKSHAKSFLTHRQCRRESGLDCKAFQQRLASSESDTRNSLLHKLLSHHFAGAEEAILYSAQRQTCDLNDLFVRQILGVTKDDKLTVVCRKGSHYAFDFNAAFFSFTLLFRTGPTAF